MFDQRVVCDLATLVTQHFITLDEARALIPSLTTNVTRALIPSLTINVTRAPIPSLPINWAGTPFHHSLSSFVCCLHEVKIKSSQIAAQQDLNKSSLQTHTLPYHYINYQESQPEFTTRTYIPMTKKGDHSTYLLWLYFLSSKTCQTTLFGKI